MRRPRSRPARTSRASTPPSDARFAAERSTPSDHRRSSPRPTSRTRTRPMPTTRRSARPRIRRSRPRSARRSSSRTPSPGTTMRRARCVRARAEPITPANSMRRPKAANTRPHGDGHGNGADGQNGHEHGHDEEEEVVESVGGADAMEEVAERAPRYRRQYKIQEVIKRRQVMLVQVVKEERGTKGAALTTYLSLAGRYCVLMPNTARGGGISRKITSADDRKKLREIAEELEVPEGMGVILRTAGAARTKAEVKRDFEYLLRHLGAGPRPDAEIDRADAGLRGRLARQALDPRSLHQGHRRDRRRRRERLQGRQGIHAHAHAEPCEEREALPGHASRSSRATASRASSTRCSRRPCNCAPAATSCINQTEALVAIDVNSGRSTREHHIEDTALKTNVEAVGGSRAPASAARSRRPDRHRLHRHGREAQQPHGRAPAQGRAAQRPRPHPGRPHLAFRPDGDVAPAHPHLGAGKLDREMPALRRHRPCALGVVGRAAAAALDRGDAAQGADPQSDRPHAARDRALRAQPQARASARARGALPASRSPSTPTRRSAARSASPSIAASR